MEEINWTYINVHIKEGTNNECVCSKGNPLENEISYQNTKSTFGIDSNYESFSSYLKRILKTPIMTKFPEMAINKSCLKKVIKTIVCILCLTGFTYQTLSFLWMYLDYSTVANVYISNPYEIVQPAITICNVNRKRRSYVCTLPDNECVKLKKETFCEIYPLYCPNNDPNKAFTSISYLNDLLDWKYNWSRTYLESHNETMIDGCRMKLGEKEYSCNKNYMRVPVVDYKGNPNYCFAIESLVGHPEAEDKLYPNNLEIDLYLNTQVEEFMMSVPVIIQIKIHDRRAVVNPFSDGFPLEGGMVYIAHVSMETQELLPPPYDTNCKDYLEMWKENNGTGPLNRLMCVEHCHLNKLLEMGQCIDENVDYPHTFQLCNKNHRTLSSEIVKKCTLECKNSCYDHHYDVRYVKVGNIHHTCYEKDEWCKKSRIKLSIIFNKFRQTRYVHRPKFTRAEVFGFIGGYMGMWFGLSLTFDLFENIYCLILYPLRCMGKRMRKRSINPEPVKNVFLETIYEP